MSSNQESSSQSPQVVELNLENCGKVLMQYVEVAQQKGAFLLNEASLLKRAADVVTGQTDPEINLQSAYTLLIQGVVKGQKHGSYTLSDASVLDKVVNFLVSQPQEQTPQQAQPQQAQPQQAPPSRQVHVQAQEQFEELEELTAPVPLNAGLAGPKVI